MDQRAGLRVTRELREPGAGRRGTARAGAACPCPGTAPAGPREGERLRARGLGRRCLTPVRCLTRAPARPRGQHKGSVSPARRCRGSAAAASTEGRGGERGATFRTTLESAGGAALAEGDESSLPRRSCGRSCTREWGRSGNGAVPLPPCPPDKRPDTRACTGRTFPIKTLPRDVREHRYLPAIKTNHSSAPLGVCHREKSPRCERAPSVLTFRETQIYFFRQGPALSFPQINVLGGRRTFRYAQTSDKTREGGRTAGEAGPE
ncbi:uncharacterized protein LOC121358615 isoform X2 [Pyrgilauda ruficollis]|uniref:uncharacterized protein LOC121358615 isoform X2 n=1 Tax=Pyrgilauda ruficollis TaxID=221976 RepID=UPI001B868E39|nr:uncharacterized protein LOC121358615 isoform X2 [Pyrgilauda ruficollis]XP_041332916.1 uncharacterized protein LOC121358615 isoform X2 [Pyrgilauda ruficollis]